MDNLQLAGLLKCQIRLLEKAFEESDGMMVGADRHEVFEYIGTDTAWRFSGIREEDHRGKYPYEWTEGHGTAKALDPIKNEIDSMKELVKALEGKKWNRKN